MMKKSVQIALADCSSMGFVEFKEVQPASLFLIPFGEVHGVFLKVEPFPALSDEEGMVLANAVSINTSSFFQAVPDLQVVPLKINQLRALDSNAGYGVKIDLYEEADQGEADSDSGESWPGSLN